MEAEIFLYFIEERHRIWEARQRGDDQPWTTDPILASHKFTNVFRVLDPGSQYVFELPDEDPRNTLMRLFLYRHTGRVDVWQYLDLTSGLPTWDTLGETLEALRIYRAGKTRSVFTGAYLVFPQSQVPGTDKLESIINLTARLFHPDSQEDVFPSWVAAETQAERFSVLRRNKGVADFMSMQILTDWGYLNGPDLENEFVVPGPGARKGAAALGTAPAEQVIDWAWEKLQEQGPTLTMPDGSIRKIDKMSVQNCACEYSKYSRYTFKPAPTRPYVPAHPGPQAPPQFPNHWF